MSFEKRAKEEMMKTLKQGLSLGLLRDGWFGLGEIREIINFHQLLG